MSDLRKDVRSGICHHELCLLKGLFDRVIIPALDMDYYFVDELQLTTKPMVGKAIIEVPWTG
jgi:hypothetical protein